MKKFLALLAATLMLLGAITGCQSKEASTTNSGAGKSGDTSKQTGDDTSKASESYFKWDGTVITGLTESGLKQKVLIIPRKATAIPKPILDVDETAEEITFLNDNIVLGEGALSCCHTLTTVTLPKNMKEMANNLLEKNSMLTHVVLPEGLSKIGVGAFGGDTNLNSIEIPSSVKEIGGCAFENCSALKSVVIPDSVTILGKGAFRDCSALEKATLPNKLKVIDEVTFKNCAALATISIPDSITTIGLQAFWGDEVLKSMTIPATVTSIGNEAFDTDAGDKAKKVLKVKKGSYADTEFDLFTDDSNCTKEYY